MNLFRQLMEKPWAAMPGGPGGPGAVVELRDGRAFFIPPAKLGLRIFFAAVSVLFFLLIVAHGSRMQLEDWRPSPRSWLLWTNTALLVFSSLAMQWSQRAAHREDSDGVRIGLLAGGGFALAFLAGQMLAWRQLNLVVTFDITNPAIAFFYIITAMHALHLLGGMVAWGRTAVKLWRGVAVARLRLSIELCTAYWHFLLLVWLVLFGLLFSGNDNLGILLTLCGLR